MNFFNAFSPGDLIAILGTLGGILTSAVTINLKTKQLGNDLNGVKGDQEKLGVRMHGIANEVHGVKLENAVRKNQVEKNENEIVKIKERQDHHDSKVLAEISKLVRAVARLEGKLGMGDDN